MSSRTQLFGFAARDVTVHRALSDTAAATPWPEGWVYQEFYKSESARLTALRAWVDLVQPPPAPLNDREVSSQTS